MSTGNGQTIGAYGSALGPRTRMRLARLAAVYAGLYGAGLLLIQFAVMPGWRAFGLGLMMPGGGFLAYTGGDPVQGILHIGLALGGVLAFGLGLFIWFATGNVLVAPAVWLLFAVIALAMNHPFISGPSSTVDAFALVPLGTAGLFVGVVVFVGVRQSLGRRAGLRNGRYVRTHLSAQAATMRDAASSEETAELSTTDIARLRFLLDRALQPLDAFEGFQWIEQFQTSAVRYQLCFSGYALAFAQAKYLPAFHGYFARAQRNLIEKQRDHRIWRYWRKENLWGNLRAHPDPIPRDNIMYTGFVAAQIAYYQAATGDRRYAEPGAFALTHSDGRSFEHDFHTMVAALKTGWDRSPYMLMPCEPNWVYPLCNGIGATAVMAHDRQSGRADWAAIALRFRDALHRELTTASGRLVPFRSTYTGIAAPQFGGSVADAFPCIFYNTALPDEALRLWLLAKRDMLRPDGSLNRRRFWPIDTGDYGFSRATSYAGVAAAAIQMGDYGIAGQALAALEQECPGRSDGGVIHRDNASVWAHAVELMARFGQVNGVTALVESTPAPGPMIETDAYPDCLPAAAYRQGRSLHAVLYPGRRAGAMDLTVSGLEPGAPFRCAGCSDDAGHADGSGKAEITVTLDGRSELTVHF